MCKEVGGGAGGRGGVEGGGGGGGGGEGGGCEHGRTHAARNIFSTVQPTMIWSQYGNACRQCGVSFVAFQKFHGQHNNQSRRFQRQHFWHGMQSHRIVKDNSNAQLRQRGEKNTYDNGIQLHEPIGEGLDLILADMKELHQSCLQMDSNQENHCLG